MVNHFQPNGSVKHSLNSASVLHTGACAMTQGKNGSEIYREISSFIM
jgi:hypothetical protein